MMSLHLSQTYLDSNTELNSDQQAPVPITIIREYLIGAALQELELVFYYIECKSIHPDATWGGKPTALCHAAMKANHQLLEYLLDKGASVEYRDALGMTPLHYATLGGSAACINTLIQHGAPLNAATHSGKTPLSLAWQAPRLASCRALLQRHGASLQNLAPAPPRFQ
jgi:ankyrin repeat protein